MVEIKWIDPSKPATLSEEDQKYRLLYSKSRVYVNPTAYARDNIPGFVALVKRVRVLAVIRLICCSLGVFQEAFNPVYLLAWIPESLLNEKGSQEWDKFIKMEEHAITTAFNEDEDGSLFLSFRVSYFDQKFLIDIVLIDLPMQRPESYAFSVPITSIYSLIVQPPTLSSWCTYAPPSFLSIPDFTG